MTAQKAIARLNEGYFPEVSVSLERMKHLLTKLQHPEGDLKFVLLGGTNGKGSVASMLYTVMNRCDYKAGVFTSHHLLCVGDRIAVDGKVISPEDLEELASAVFAVADQMELFGLEFPTQEEILLAVALLYFRKVRTEIVFWEVGEDGILDPSKALGVPVVTALANMDYVQREGTEVSLEEFLSPRLEILKEGTELVLYQQDEAVMEYVISYCKKKKIPITLSTCEKIKPVSQSPKEQKLMIEGKVTQLSLVGGHQRCNMALALDVLGLLRQRGFGFSRGSMMAGFSRIVLPGRFERVHISPDFILDGCHNVQSIRAVLSSLKEVYPEQCGEMIFIMGVLQERDYSGMVEEILPFARKIITVTAKNSHALAAKTLASCVSDLVARAEDCQVSVVACECLSEGVSLAMEEATGTDVVCALGSTHIVGEIRLMLGLC